MTEVMAATYIAKNGRHGTGINTLSILADVDIYRTALATVEAERPNDPQLSVARAALNIHHGIE